MNVDELCLKYKVIIYQLTKHHGQTLKNKEFVNNKQEQDEKKIKYVAKNNKLINVQMVNDNFFSHKT